MIVNLLLVMVEMLMFYTISYHSILLGIPIRSKAIPT